MNCTHSQIYPGLDCAYCCDCGQEFLPGTKQYEKHMSLSPGQSQNGSCVTTTHEHTCSSSPLMWVQIYAVNRRGTKHKYFRFCYLLDPKNIALAVRIHLPGGNVNKAEALGLKREVERAIAQGKSPAMIEQLIKERSEHEKSSRVP